MKKMIVYSVWFLLMPVFSIAANGSSVPLDKVIAVVNNSVITQSQLDTLITDTKSQLTNTDAHIPSQSELNKQALDLLIDQTLQLQVAERNKIQVTDAEVDETIAKIAAQNHLTVAQLKNELVKQGVAYQKFRTQLHDQLVLRHLHGRMFARKINITDQEVKAFMKNTSYKPNPNALYHLDDLLIPMSESPTAAETQAARKKAQTLIQKAQKGNNFSEIASTESSNGLILQNNDLGWRKISEFPALFVDPVKNMEIGAVKGPIQAPNGLHIIKLLEINGQAEVMTEITAKNKIFQQKMNEEISNWLKLIRKSSYVKIM